MSKAALPAIVLLLELYLLIPAARARDAIKPATGDYVFTAPNGIGEGIVTLSDLTATWILV